MRRRRWFAAISVLLAVAALVVWLTRPDGTPRKHPYSPTPVAGAAPPALAVHKAAVVVHPKPRHKETAGFVFMGPKFTIRANLCTMANIRPYDPPGDEHHNVCWVTGYGGGPGSTKATTFLFAHSWAPDPLEVLNKASALATKEFLQAKPITMRSVTPTADYVPYSSRTQVFPVRSLNGYTILLNTKHGSYTYRVRNAYAVRKILLGDLWSWETTTVPGRLVLTTCSELNGVDYDYNVVFDAYLVTSPAAQSTSTPGLSTLRGSSAAFAARSAAANGSGRWLS